MTIPRSGGQAGGMAPGPIVIGTWITHVAGLRTAHSDETVWNIRIEWSACAFCGMFAVSRYAVGGRA